MEIGDIGDWLRRCGSKCETKRKSFRVKGKERRAVGLAGSGQDLSTASFQSTRYLLRWTIQWTSSPIIHETTLLYRNIRMVMMFVVYLE